MSGLRKLACPRLALAGLLVLVLTACGIGNDWPHSTDGTTWPQRTGHRNILLFGDSLMGNTATQLPAVFAAHGYDATFTNYALNGSGLVGYPYPNGWDAQTYVAHAVVDHPEAQIMVVSWSGACQRPCSYPYGSDAFLNAWMSEAQGVVNVGHFFGRTVIWALSPPPPPGCAPVTGPYEFCDNTATTIAYRYGSLGVPNPSWWAALAAKDDFIGHYDTQLFYDGATHDVRLADGIHLSADGATRTATWTAATVADHW